MTSVDRVLTSSNDLAAIPAGLKEHKTGWRVTASEVLSVYQAREQRDPVAVE